MVKMEQLIAADLNANGVFAACSNHIDKFKQYAGQYGSSLSLLAFRRRLIIAHQSSPSCSHPSPCRSQPADPTPPVVMEKQA